LKEKMRPLQWAAVAIASIGVLILTIDYGRLPWIAFTLALSWGSYGLIKKQLGLGALEGLAIETFISGFFYLGYLIYIGNQGIGQFGHSWGLTLYNNWFTPIHHPNIAIFHWRLGSTRRYANCALGWFLDYLGCTHNPGT
jgi:RarD protein